MDEDRSYKKMAANAYGNEYDPHAAKTFDEHFAGFAPLRAGCPVAHSEAFDGFWALTRYADIAAVLENSDNFITSVRNVIPSSSTSGRRPPLHLDPPEHTPYRRAIDRALSAKRIAQIEPIIRRNADALLDKYLARGEGDLVEHYGSPLPALVFGEWLGLTEGQTDALHLNAQEYVKAFESFDKEAVGKAAAALSKMSSELVADRRVNPRDPTIDPTSSLLMERDANGEPFPETLLLGCVRQILVVGLVAPPILLGSIAVHLSQDQALQQRLRAEPELIDDAFEEFVRLYTPYRGFARTSRTEITLHGRTIKPGDPIALIYTSANRDPEIFEDPDEFRLNRPNIGKHLAFGRGPHRCAGAALGRTELKIALSSLLARTKRFELNGPVKMSGMPEVGPVSVPLRFVG